MYDCYINGIDPWVPELVKSSRRKFQDFSDILFDVYSFPNLYSGFPDIPKQIFSDWKLNSSLSIIKKWETFYIVERGSKWWNFLETLIPFFDEQVIFSFTNFDFPFLCKMDFDRNPNWLASEWLLNTYVYDILRY
jgi:hypothetical protein